MIHGYPTSSWDWEAVARDLATDHYVCLLDTPGYGFSDKPRDGWAYSLFDDARLVDRFVTDELHLESFTLVTHDKGDTVGLALLQLCQARERSTGGSPYQIRAHVILTGNVWLPLARLTGLQKAYLSRRTGPLISRLMCGRALAMALGFRLYTPRLDVQATRSLASILDYQGGTRIQHQIIRYLDERRVHEARWLAALVRSNAPTILVWGEKDPVAPTAVADFVWDRVLAAEAGHAAPASYWRLPGANHYLQVGRPDVIAWLVRAAAAGARPDPAAAPPGVNLVAAHGQMSPHSVDQGRGLLR